MRKQKGFTFTLFMGVAVFLGTLMLASMGVAYIQTQRLKTCASEYAAFVASAKAIAEQAAKQLKERAQWNAYLAKDMDIEKDHRFAALAAANKRLRDAGASGPIQPPVSPAAPDPSVACYDRAKLERALAEFVGEAEAIAERGDQLAIELQLSREWVKEQQRRD